MLINLLQDKTKEGEMDMFNAFYNRCKAEYEASKVVGVDDGQ